MPVESFREAINQALAIGMSNGIAIAKEDMPFETMKELLENRQEELLDKLMDAILWQRK